MTYISSLRDLPGNFTARKSSNASIAIVGGGIPGLATALMLDSVGVHNWEIIEASDRVGGRFRTVFVGDMEEFAEMGLMRLPYQVTYKSDNSTHAYSDHCMTFQLADVLDRMNENDEKYRIDFIPWIQHHPNELLAFGTGRHPDGRVPSRAEIAKDPSLGAPPVMTSAECNNTKKKMNNVLKIETLIKEIQADIWGAHKQSLLRNRLNADENVTDAIWTSTDYDVIWDEMVHNYNLALDGSDDTLGVTEWKCVDKGFNRMSDACIPHASDRLILNRKIRKLEPVHDEAGNSRTRLPWYPGAANRTFESKDYDYTSMAAVGALYYPVYGLNESGPGLITHYRGGEWSNRFVSFTEEEHDLYRRAHGSDSCLESSSLYSSVRGSFQLLLELGKVHEAKKLNQEWMGQWIH
ncbi:L-amino-acid oxidase [Colletotrichum asianum]